MAENQHINQYFDGDMSPEEMQAFETQIAKDPVLQKEFIFEKELIEGIQDARKAELKAKLSNVDVSGVATTSTVGTAKVLTGIVATGIIAVSGYLYLQKDKTISEENNPVAEIENTQNSSITTIESDEIAETNEIPDESEKVVLDNDEGTKVVAEHAEISGTQETSSEEVDFNEANISENFDEDEVEVSETEAPTNHLIAKSKMVISPMEVKTENSKRYNNHYQVKNGALILYGDFNELYEVIDFHKDGNVTTYFKYKNNYFEIDKQQTKPSELVALEGEDLLNLLDSIENNKER